jgi:hypothetical protein
MKSNAAVNNLKLSNIDRDVIKYKEIISRGISSLPVIFTSRSADRSFISPNVHFSVRLVHYPAIANASLNIQGNTYTLDFGCPSLTKYYTG